MIAAAPGACKSFGRMTDDSAESDAPVAQRIEKVAQNAAQQAGLADAEQGRPAADHAAGRLAGYSSPGCFAAKH